jgi:hypothetical protein
VDISVDDASASSAADTIDAEAEAAASPADPASKPAEAAETEKTTDKGLDPLDHNSGNGYTDIISSGVSSVPAGSAANPASPALAPSESSSEETAEIDALPDLDTMSAAFDGEGAASGGGSYGDVSSGPAAGSVLASDGSISATLGLTGDPALSEAPNENSVDALADKFDVKEMASAIETILKKDDKG